MNNKNTCKLATIYALMMEQILWHCWNKNIRFNYIIVHILEIKSQFGTRFFKNLKLILFVLKSLKFAFSVKSGETMSSEQ